MYSELYSHCMDFLWKSKIAKKIYWKKFINTMEPMFQQAGFRQSKRTSAPSILVLRLDAGGDNILTTPMLRELRRNQPHSHITLVTSSAGYSLMELCPYTDEVLSIPSASLDCDLLKGIHVILEFSKKHLWQHYFDICLLPQWPSTLIIYARIMAYLSGAQERWGYSDTVQNQYAPLNLQPTDELYFLNHLVCHPPEIIHAAKRNLYLLKAMGMTIKEQHSELWTSTTDKEKAQKIVIFMRKSPELMIITLSTGAGKNNRKYPPSQWVSAMKEIIRMGGRFLLIGGPAEEKDNLYLEQHLPSESVLNLTGQTTLRESVALIAASDLFMGNDSGMMHAAAACKRPLIAIYREAADKESQFTGIYSEFRRFEPYMADYITLRPEHAIGKCKDSFCYGGCQEEEAHCICQVKPEEIVEAFRIMKEKYHHTYI